MTHHEDPETFTYCGYAAHVSPSEWSACYVELMRDPRWAEHEALCSALPQVRAVSTEAIDRLQSMATRCAGLEAELIQELDRIVQRRVNLGI